MTVERIDPETLAAFLDGRLEGAERDRVMRFIAENPEEFETFSDAAHVAAELERKEPKVLPIARASSKRFWYAAIPALVAAGIAAIVVVPRLDGGGLTPAALARDVNAVTTPGNGSLARHLGEGWDQPGWSVTRGPGADMVESALAFRVGVRATDVEIAIRARDTTALRSVGNDLVQLLSSLDAGAPSASLYRGIVAAGIDGPEADRTAAAAGLTSLLGDSPWFDLGAWVEAARVAAAAGQAEFGREHRSLLGKIVARLEARGEPENAEVTGLVKELEARLDSADGEWVKGQLSRVIVVAGR